MKKMTNAIKTIPVCAILIAMCMGQAAPDGCAAQPPPAPSGAQADVARQQQVQNRMGTVQATPTDIRFSLERFNLIRRAYWVNGMRERAVSLPCPVERPVGHIVLLEKAKRDKAFDHYRAVACEVERLTSAGIKLTKGQTATLKKMQAALDKTVLPHFVSEKEFAKVAAKKLD